MIKEVKGNLLDMFDEGKFDFIIHGCNCFNTLADGTAKGLARQIGDRYPQARIADKESGHNGDWNKLGDYSLAETDKGTIINLYTQYLPGKNFEYSALVCGLDRLQWLFDEKGSDTRIGIPLIGCGIGGGDWNVVKEIIKDYLDEFDVTIVYYEEFKRDKIRSDSTVSGTLPGESAIISSDRETKDSKPQMVRTIQSTNKSLYAPTVYTDGIRKVRLSDKSFN